MLADRQPEACAARRGWGAFIPSILALGLALGPVPGLGESAFAPGTVGFAVKVGGEITRYEVLGLYVLPRQELSIEAAFAPAEAQFGLYANAGVVQAKGARRWTWRAPAEPGLFPLEVVRRDTSEKMLLNVFVMVPHERVTGGNLEGYRIGAYPKEPLRGLSIYRPPRGFVRVTVENFDTPISPHFTLGQFVCKQDGGFPKFVVLRERLLLKLEYLLRAVNDKGFRTDSFLIMSGYRTPHYNRAIGNVPYSRHQWGDAADIFIDVSPQDGVMDDLNGDGRFDRRDAELLGGVVESLYRRHTYVAFIGGLGLYGTTSNHGPFIHVDARGFKARW